MFYLLVQLYILGLDLFVLVVKLFKYLLLFLIVRLLLALELLLPSLHLVFELLFNGSHSVIGCLDLISKLLLLIPQDCDLAFVHLFHPLHGVQQIGDLLIFRVAQ